MELDGKKIDLPVVSKLSFSKIFDTLEELVKGEDPQAARYAKDLLDDLAPYPFLREGTEDLSIIEKHSDLIQRMMRLLFPPILTTNEIKMAAPPYTFKPFYMSKRFENILEAAGEDFEIELKDMTEDEMYIMSCAMIMQAHYGFPINLRLPLIIEIPNGDRINYYRSAFNADLMEIFPAGEAPEITEADYLRLMDDFSNVELWKEYFPVDSWIIRGVGIINLMDVTMDQSINMMTSNLLEGSKDTFEKVVDNLRTLLGLKDIEISFVRMEGDQFLSVKKYDNCDVLMHGIDEAEVSEAICPVGKDTLIKSQQPFVLTDTETYIEQADNLLAKQLKTRGVKSYMMVPVVYNDVSLGLLEISSFRKHDLNAATMERLNLALPILSMAANRFHEEAQNRIEAIIQKECTTIHPSVKWRFEQAAKQYMEAEDIGERPVFENLIFNDVHPLYGQLDIKSSSSKRNEAVKADLITQLKAIRAILKAALREEGLPAYEEMLFRIDGYLTDLKGELLAGSEQKILSFLQADIYPVFDHLKSIPTLAKAVEDYNGMLFPKLNMVYEKRRAFDESVGKINHVLADYLDEKQREAQVMFPHYFERYKTDGVEYNMYIGQSITNEKTFSRLYLQNLQLWQLSVMCELEHTFRQLQPQLSAELEVASLILTYRGAMSIHFRMDEKRFDVEGAYNARYEIIKKRVDKAHIKGTDERITAPGKIAIIYTASEDALEYQRHIQYLESRGYLIPDSLEMLELEDLQGITGLKAMRVTVDYSQAEQTIDIQHLMDTIEGE